MATIPDLITRARLELGDQAKPFQRQYEGDGVTTRLETPRKPLAPNTLTLTLKSSTASTTLLQGTGFTTDDANGIVTLTNPVPVGTVLTISGSAYEYFTDDEWTTFVSTAVTEHLHGRPFDEDLTSLPQVEEHPVAIYATVQALYVLVNEAASQIDISTPEGVSIPRRQRYEQLSTMLAARMDQYNKIAGALNVGLWRIEMFDLRRVSRTTNRLVPLYQDQEFEDSGPPMQVFPVIDTLGGRARPIVVAPTVNLYGYSTNEFTYSTVLNQDVSAYYVRASIRKYPSTRTPLAVFHVNVLDATTGSIEITMTADLMYFIGLNKFYDIQLIDQVSGNTTTVQHGTFDAIRVGNAG